MDKKIKVLALVSLAIAASVAASIVPAMQSTAKADSNSSFASDVQPTLSPVRETNDSGIFINGHIGFGDYGGMERGCRGIGGFGEFGANPSEL